jgi:hypothetical protein
MWAKSFGSIVLLALFAGCGPSGPELAPVSGRVMLNGRPLENADVVFQPAGSKRPSYGQTDAEGRYQLAFKRGEAGALVGDHTVLISVSPEIVRKPPHIPPRYNTLSELKREVKSGEENVFDFDIKTEAESSKSSPKTE